MSMTHNQVWWMNMSPVNCGSLSGLFRQLLISSPTLSTSQLIKLPTGRQGRVCVLGGGGGGGVKKTQRSLGRLSALYRLTPSTVGVNLPRKTRNPVVNKTWCLQFRIPQVHSMYEYFKSLKEKKIEAMPCQNILIFNLEEMLIFNFHFFWFSVKIKTTHPVIPDNATLKEPGAALDTIHYCSARCKLWFRLITVNNGR